MSELLSGTGAKDHLYRVLTADNIRLWYHVTCVKTFFYVFFNFLGAKKSLSDIFSNFFFDHDNMRTIPREMWETE